MVSRYLEIRSAGVMDWLTSPIVTAEQKVFATLAGEPRGAELAPADLARRSGMEVREFARILFELNRRNSIVVGPGDQAHAIRSKSGKTSLDDELAALAPGGSRLLLAGGDGLCVAHHGLAGDECIALAAACGSSADPRFPVVVPLHLDGARFCLLSSAPIDMAGEAVVRIVRHLARMARFLHASEPAGTHDPFIQAAS